MWTKNLKVDSSYLQRRLIWVNLRLLETTLLVKQVTECRLLTCVEKRVCAHIWLSLSTFRQGCVRGYSLLTIAVGRMEAMAACCGRSWMLSSSRAGYMPSLRDMWFTACSRESKSTANATSSSPSIMFLVVVHHSWPPAQMHKTDKRFPGPCRWRREGFAVWKLDWNFRPLCNVNVAFWRLLVSVVACITVEVKQSAGQDITWIIFCFIHCVAIIYMYKTRKGGSSILLDCCVLGLSIPLKSCEHIH